MAISAPRPIRSYIRRNGRTNPKHQTAFDQFATNFCMIAPDRVEFMNFRNIFGRDVPINLEIGFGMGSHLLNLAMQHPEQDFIGIEVHAPGVARVVARAQELGLTNLRLFHQDAVQVLANAIDLDSLQKIYILFPDPWPKRRHHKRRLIQTEFISLISSRLRQGGELHLATDWQDYAEQMMLVMDNHADFDNTVGQGNFAVAQFRCEQTKFEARGQRLGHAIRDLVYRRR